MKRSIRVLTFSLFALFVCMGLNVSCISDARAGDAGLDGFLSRLDVQAKANIGDFSTRLAAHFGTPRPQVDAIIRVVDKPSDAFMIFQLARFADKPVNVVERQYQLNKRKGWGNLAQSLGIKPGSKEFHALKRGDFDFDGDQGQGQGKGKGKGKGHNKRDED